MQAAPRGIGPEDLLLRSAALVGRKGEPVRDLTASLWAAHTVAFHLIHSPTRMESNP